MRITAVLLVAALVLPEHAIAQTAAGAEAGGAHRPTRAEKRCLAAERREQRQRDVVAEVDAQMAAATRTRSVCTSKRACSKLDHDLKSLGARKQRYDRQLAQYQSETAAACARP